jgi:Fe-S oxidoreductase/nitrate reductase gamma subunit
MEAILFGTLLGTSLSYFLYQIYRRFRLTQFGRPDKRNDHPFERLSFFIKRVLLQRNLRGYPLSALFHTFIMWGFFILTLSSMDTAWNYFFHSKIPFIGTNPGFLFIRDTVLLLALLGVLGFLFRRLFFKPEWLHNSKNAYLILILILAILLSELLYLTLTAESVQSPIEKSWLFKAINNALFLKELNSTLLLKFSFWVHFLLIFSFFYIIPRSKHLHLIFAPFNVYWHSRVPKGALISVELDIEKEQTCGVKTVEDFTWKQLFDTFSCVKCGYCHGQCPAEQSKEWLKPKRINGRIRSFMEEEGFKGNTEGKPPIKVVGDLFHLDFIQSCTTCGGCNNACPVSIDHLSKIIDMRRTIVSEKIDVSPEAQRVFESVERYGNPQGKERIPENFSWAKDMKIPTLMEKPEAEYLLFIGCQGTLDSSSQNAAIAFSKVLQAAKVDFAILGKYEWCCGETVRRMGNERLFQKTVRKNIDYLNGFGIKKIITTCPHCYNTFKNEYPEFGGSYEVIPHSVFLANLLCQNNLCISQEQNWKIAYHDPCYLSHYNDIYNEPREVLSAVPGINLIEMPRAKEKSFCCGSGGGRFWEKTNSQNPITKNRFQETLATGAQLIVTSCPYCKTTFKEEIHRRELSQDVRTLDIAELVSLSLRKKE